MRPLVEPRSWVLRGAFSHTFLHRHSKVLDRRKSGGRRSSSARSFQVCVDGAIRSIGSVYHGTISTVKRVRKTVYCWLQRNYQVNNQKKGSCTFVHENDLDWFNRAKLWKRQNLGLCSRRIPEGRSVRKSLNILNGGVFLFGLWSGFSSILVDG